MNLAKIFRSGFFRPAVLIALLVCASGAAMGQASGDGSQQKLTDQQQKLKNRAVNATRNFTNAIGLYSSAYHVEAELIMAVITVESDGNPNSLSSAGAMGLMQLMPETCLDYHVDQPFDPDSNIRGGTAMLANHFRRYHGDVEKVLAAYNAGIRHADDGSWVNISETRHYVPAVIAIYQALKGSTDLPTFNNTQRLPTLPPERNIDATPPTPAEDLMFQAIRWSPNISDPAGLNEDSRLEDAASSLLTLYLAGRVGDNNLQRLAAKAVAASHRKPKSLKAYCLTTRDLTGFQERWNQEPKMEGNVLGVAHSRTATGHVWIILVASF